MGKRTGNPRGRPPKSENEKAEKHLVSFKPQLWARLAALVPVGDRSEFIQGAVVEKLDREEGDGN